MELIPGHAGAAEFPGRLPAPCILLSALSQVLTAHTCVWAEATPAPVPPPRLDTQVQWDEQHQEQPRLGVQAELPFSEVPKRARSLVPAPGDAGKT